MKLATYINPNQQTVIGAVDVSSHTVLDLQASHKSLHGIETPSFVD
jgi:hypothetical protein